MSIVFHILKFPILVFVVNVILDRTGVYVALLWIDMPMHFLGGVSIAVAGMSFLAFLQRQKFVNALPFLLHVFFVMSFVGLAAASWELWEFSLDIVFARHMQTDLFDTMTDMFFGLSGGLITLILWGLFRRLKALSLSNGR